MGDLHVEQMIKKNNTIETTIIRLCSIVSGILVMYIALVLIGIISLVLGFAIVYGIYYLFLMTNIEYEYIFVNGDLVIDTIYGQNKRKRNGTYDLKKCEIIAPISSTYAAGFHKNNNLKSMDYTSGLGQDNVYLIAVGQGDGNTKIYFEPNRDMLEAIKTSVPNKLKDY